MKLNIVWQTVMMTIVYRPYVIIISRNYHKINDLVKGVKIIVLILDGVNMSN